MELPKFSVLDLALVLGSSMAMLLMVMLLFYIIRLP